MSDINKPIEFGKKPDPKDEETYRKKIENARLHNTGVNALKSSTPVGHVAKNEVDLTRPSTEAAKEVPTSVTPRPPGSPAISKETAKQIAEFQEAQKKTENSIEEEVKKQLVDEEDSLRSGPRDEAMLVLSNNKRRKAIESRCSEMDVGDLILKGEVRQVVPIIPDKFVATFRSTLPEESLFIKKLVAEATTVSDQHTLEYYGILQLCLSLVQLNNMRLPGHLDEHGNPNEALFAEKKKTVMRLSGYVINDLMINLSWFDIRVRKLMNADLMGNG